MKLKPSKCCFAKQCVQFLGHVVSKHGIAPDPVKLAALQRLAAPTNLKTLRQFQGLASYYWRFVAQIAAPFHKLLQKETTWYWSPECQVAFQKLKHALTSPPILAFPNFKLPFLLETDASSFGLGAILSQNQSDGSVRMVAAGSRTLSRAEKNYSATEREALGIVWAVKHFRPYLYGHRFTVITDHSALKWLMTCKSPSGRLQRWSLTLQEYDFDVQHKPGKSMVHVDALSRLPTTAAHVLFKQSVPTSLALQQRKDSGLLPLIEYLEKGILPLDPQQQLLIECQAQHYRLLNNVLFHIPSPTCRTSYQYPEQIVVPTALRPEVISHFHDSLFGGHLGIRRTREKIAMRYFWPKLDKDIENWVSSCTVCASKKSPPNLRRAPLTPIAVSGPFDRVAVDVVGPLPQTLSGNRFIVGFTDYHTKWAEAFPTSDHTATTVAQLLLTEIVCRHGSPLALLPDQGPEFLSAVVNETCKLANINHVYTSAYHPETDGLQEKFNHTLIQMLAMYVNSHHTDWDLWIPYCLFSYRTAVQESTKETPFYLLYNRDARQPNDLAFQQHCSIYVPFEDDPVKLAAIHFTEVNELALRQIELAQNQQK